MNAVWSLVLVPRFEQFIFQAVTDRGNCGTQQVLRFVPVQHGIRFALDSYLIDWLSCFRTPFHSNIMWLSMNTCLPRCSSQNDR